MALKQKIFLGLALALLVGGIFLALRRSQTSETVSGEIRHLTQSPQVESLRIQGETLEAFIDHHILLNDRIRQIDWAKKHHGASPASTRAKTNDTSSQTIAATTPPVATPHDQTTTSPSQMDTNRSNDLPKNGEENANAFQPGVELIHEVSGGDYLGRLASQYHTTRYKIAKLNNISENAMLRIGQKLRIVPEQPSIYRVRPGDNLTIIARRFGVTRSGIEAINHLDASRPIWVGQRLILPTEQKKIDRILAEIKKKEEEEAERKRRFQRQLYARLEEQKRQRKLAEARAKAEAKRKERLKRQQAKAAKERERQSRLEKAKHAFKKTGAPKYKHKLRVVATAYTSHRNQTDSTPFLAAWNNRIRPGMKIIAVSPDLIRKYGLTNGVRVKIGGLPGTYVVRDKMHPRLHNHIDIYMGVNRRRALRWGRRRVVLYW